MSISWHLLHQVKKYGLCAKTPITTSKKRAYDYMLPILPDPMGTAYRPDPLPRWYGSFQSSIMPSLFEFT